MTDTTEVINVLSVDVEGFIEANLQSFHINKKYVDKTKETYEIETNINLLLDLLNDLKIEATFFFLGRIARDMPQIVKEAAQAGHEIGCHSY